MSSLEEENDCLRAELQRVRAERDGLREKVEQLCAAQAHSQEMQLRLTELSQWPQIELWNAEEGDLITRCHYFPSEIIVALKREYQVLYNDADAKALLRMKGFNEDDVREFTGVSLEGEFFPMIYFCFKGDLMMCQWLYANGAAEDISRINEDEPGWTPMIRASFGGHLSVCKWLFEVGADRDISRAANNGGCTPMFAASGRGNLSVCKWLFEMGANGDISRADIDGATPMMMACKFCHLSVCKWLFEVGANEDISRANSRGSTPMHMACRGGHLSVCKWLFEVGADGDISTADNFDQTPMFFACMSKLSALEICEWLVLKGALNDPDSAGQHITQAIVERETRAPPTYPYHHRPRLLAWAQGVVAASDSFRNTVIMGTFSPSSSTPAAVAVLLRRALIATGTPAANAEMIVETLPEDLAPGLLQKLRPRPAISKLSGLAGVLELVADFLGGVRRGRELRNARELAECLVAMGVVVTADEDGAASDDSSNSFGSDDEAYDSDDDSE